ncbi:MAG TPA: hypothetical protein DCE78_10525 [Bacteroidetes bacterium]|nr:hypothetical protein [Bacteroidota bacterium]
MLFKTSFSSLVAIIISFATFYSPTELSAQQNVTVAGQDVQFRLGATIQPRFTYYTSDLNDDTIEQIGFGLRRFRLRNYISIGKQWAVFSQLEGSGLNAQLLDMRVDYKLNPEFTIRGGRFAGAQPRSMAFTLHSDIDAIDRPAISEYWAKNTIGADARDYGLEVMYHPDFFEFRVFLHNGDNRNNIRPGASDEIPTSPRTKMAVSSSFRYFPLDDTHTEIGIFGGLNKNSGHYEASDGYYTAAFHVYRGAFPGHYPFRIKIDAIMIRHLEVESHPERFDHIFTGASLFAGYLISKETEAFVKAETYRVDRHVIKQDVNLFSGGVTYSFSAAQDKNFNITKLTAMYNIKDDSLPDRIARFLQLQLQILL